MKKTVEKEALLYLQSYDKKRYQSAEISDKPDIKNRELSIGVEVTVVEFKEIIVNSKLIGKNLIEYFKMTGTSFLIKESLNYFQELPENHFVINSFLSHRPVYENENKKPKFINTISDLGKLPNKTKIYLPPKSILLTIDDEGIIKFSPGTAQWVGQLPNKMMESLKKKELKIDGYEKFSEINLYIKCFSADEEEIKNFEKLVREYNANDKCKFKRVYVTNYWGVERIYEIKL